MSLPIGRGQPGRVPRGVPARANAGQAGDFPRPPPPEKVERLLAAAREERAKRLVDLQGAPYGSPVFPEDGTVRAASMQLGVLAGEEDLDVPYVAEVAKIARQEGFRVRVLTSDPRAVYQRLPPELHPVVDPVVVEKPFRWPEDPIELSRDGSLSWLSGEDQAALVRATLTDRRARLPRPVSNAYFISIGGYGGSQRSSVAAGAQLGKALHEHSSYLEGGNVLVGTLASGELYALVGRDSVATTRAVLEKDLGHAVSEAEANLAIAKDLGIPVERIIPIEQPRDFHLDMYLLPLPAGRVLLNDARAVARLEERWARADHLANKPVPPPPEAPPEEHEKYRAALKDWNEWAFYLELAFAKAHSEANTSAQFERLITTRMKKAGLAVHPVPGVFRGLTIRDDAPRMSMRMNFLNAEQGMGKNGKRFFITLGGEPRAQQTFVEHLRRIEGDALPRLYFLPAELSKPTLDMEGGLSCRVKLDGVS